LRFVSVITQGISRDCEATYSIFIRCFSF